MVFKQSASQNDAKVVQKEVVVWMKSSSSSAKSVLFVVGWNPGALFISNLQSYQILRVVVQGIINQGR